MFGGQCKQVAAIHKEYTGCGMGHDGVCGKTVDADTGQCCKFARMSYGRGRQYRNAGYP